ncbi:transcription initiation factor TFIID subunit 12-like isoform X7 [Thunnus maccoyii]|uniref:transcription initiation factor TFIID subunit 12-like isoform X7 n=1 Tax=Thunnus maccoyii TaxID=8240 RepID=UPI001C4B3253|nr:transcription initiation factor TFIID subunit 12-like isoform X7 [Thunnus maccoyii]
MRMNICSCLLALVLGCNVTAEIIHQIVKEEQQVSLRCSHSVEGKVTWSREINGNTVDIFIVDGDRDQRFNDPHKRYSSAVDKSLHISRVAVSDSGKYLCNNESAVELTVIPSGTTTVSIAEKSNVNLTCPDVGGSHVPTWTREIDGKQQQIRPHVSAVDKYLNIPDVQPGDSGLYYCDGKPAAYLNVTKGDQSEREENRTSPPTTSTITTPTTTTSTTTAPKKRSHTKKPGNKKKKGKDKKKPTSPTTTSTTSPPAANTGVESSGGPSAEYCLETFSGGSNQNEPTYCTIPDLPPMGNKIDTYLTESPYSMITDPLPDGNKTGTPQLNDPTYSLLKKPKVLENNDQYLYSFT